ncbi:hypothetical protein [Psychromicrobium lacuslunae]|uniref:Uncharacterized protein n=1 Tax=Psychromicrobium lacuslunae TaxID=1618207 RepID=A0A0D4C1W2_9MICC|nr:hypothetical protein [Psychromicrobium lacuslunae]AJT42662.1 hypothetical protein UM93_16430 [Psychromicrobium lacuslunae]
MDVFWTVLVIFLGFAVMMAALGWLAVRARKARVSSLGVIDEIYLPAATAAKAEIQQELERAASMPSPGDPDTEGQEPGEAGQADPGVPQR